MPSRNFCDLCDKVIDSEECYFQLEVTAVGKDKYGSPPTYISEKSQHTHIEDNHGMVCKKCIIAILKKRDELGGRD